MLKLAVVRCLDSARLLKFSVLFVNLAKRTAVQWQREPPNGVPERGTPGPAGEEPFDDCPAEQDVYPRV